MKLKYSIHKFLKINVGINTRDRILIICNSNKSILANNIKNISESMSLSCDIIYYEDIFNDNFSIDDTLFLKYNAILTNTDVSLFHNEVINRVAKNGVKVISLTGADLNTFTGKAAEADFLSISSRALKIREIITQGNHLLIETMNGTHIEGDITGRIANAETGINSFKNPSVFPDIEVNTSIIESTCNGKLYIDLSMTKFGKLIAPLYISIVDGKIKDIKGEQSEEIIKWLNSYDDPNIFQVAEFGFGLNPMAEITGNIIEDESKQGTAHIGFGNNIFMGGQNKAKIHFDMVLNMPKVYLDQKLIIDGSNFTL